MPRQSLRSETELHLPFDDEWLCFWGGDTAKLNYHRSHDAPDQRFAIDFVKVNESGGFHREGFVANNNSYSFGLPVLSPGRGTVIDVMDELPDNQLGDTGKTVRAIGNYVLIRHSAAEYSVLAHLRRGSAAVGIAQKVQAGDVVGDCGNSGHSTDPHLHYHLQNSPYLNHYAIEEPESIRPVFGIKPYFSNILRQRHGVTKPAKRCSPIRGDIVSNA